MLTHIRSALYLPASNPRAIAKARTLPCDLVILDLEDAVAPADKAAARDAAVAATREDWNKPLAVRINTADTLWHADDLAGLEGLSFAAVVIPKVEQAVAATAIARRLGKPALAMIETPGGIYAAREIAAADGVAGLIAGSNDLASTLRLPADAGREDMSLALQAIVLAARAAGVIALDGVYNRLDDAEGFAADARAGRAQGFDGKTLIHPGQVEPANRIFSPTPVEVEEARALIAAATGGAVRFRGRMIETLHVEAARTVLGRADPALQANGDDARHGGGAPHFR